MKKLYYAIAALLMMVFIILGLFNKMKDHSGDDAGYSDNSVTFELVDSEPDVDQTVADADPVEPVTDPALPEEVIDLGQLPGNIQYVNYTFRNSRLLNEHYEKHGIEMGFASAAEYEAAASAVINNPAALSKTEKEDGDYVYYVEATNEFVILSLDGYIRTYFYPSAGKAYYDRK